MSNYGDSPGQIPLHENFIGLGSNTAYIKLLKSERGSPPAKLWQLLRMALDDMKAMPRDKYVPSACGWHQPEYEFGFNVDEHRERLLNNEISITDDTEFGSFEHCLVCLGGSILTGTSLSPYREMAPILYSPATPLPNWTAAMLTLDALREGNIGLAADRYYGEESEEANRAEEADERTWAWNDLPEFFGEYYGWETIPDGAGELAWEDHVEYYEAFVEDLRKLDL